LSAVGVAFGGLAVAAGALNYFVGSVQSSHEKIGVLTANLEKERENLKESTLKNLQEGMVVKGVIKNITEYGAFVDLGGIDGLLHITDMSWGRVQHPDEIFKVGDEVFDSDDERGRVCSIDPEDAEKFKDENMYKFHENTQSFDPQIQPFSYFYVTIMGQIEFGEFF
jgi:predicted RNA-binding protein with RPS1 domain